MANKCGFPSNQMKFTKSQNPNLAKEIILGDGKNVDKLFLQKSFQIFPKLPTTDKSLKYSVIHSSNIPTKIPSTLNFSQTSHK